MLLLIESLIGIALFTLIVVPMDIKDPLAVIGDYPPAIRKRCEDLGLIEKRDKQLSKRELLRKGVAVAALVIVAACVMIKVNRATTFLQGFGYAYIIWLAITWYFQYRTIGHKKLREVRYIYRFAEAQTMQEDDFYEDIHDPCLRFQR